MNNLKNKKIAVYMRVGTEEQARRFGSTQDFDPKNPLSVLSKKLNKKLKEENLHHFNTDLIILNRFFKQNHCRYISVDGQLQKQKAR